METVYFQSAANLEILKVEIPQVNDDQVLIKVAACGICGSDHHLIEGEAIAKFPLVPGHEVVGAIAKVGKDVKGVVEGDRVVVDPVTTCENCFYCRRGQSVLCENLGVLGGTVAGGCAEYVAVQGRKVFKINNLTDEEATLVEPTSCVIHCADKLGLGVGSEVLVLGAGPSGLMLSQILKVNGASKVVIAANKGIKTRIAREIGAADEYIEIDRNSPEAGWKHLKDQYPYGFDAVVEATGNEKVANDSINYVRRGGKLMLYGLYDKNALVHWPPSKIFGDEIQIIGSFAQTYCFARAVEYLESGKVNVKGIVTDEYALKDFQKAMDKLNNRQALKVIIKPSLGR